MIVNTYWMHHIWTGVSESWNGGTENEDAIRLRYFDTDNSAHIGLIVKEFVIPQIYSLPVQSVERDRKSTIIATASVCTQVVNTKRICDCALRSPIVGAA